MTENSCPRLNTFVDADLDVLTILKVVRPNWKKSDIILEHFSAGTINKMIGCHMRNDVDNKVVVRIYADKLDDIMDRKAEVENVLKLSSRGCAPKMLAIFVNGFCYEFFAGECLNIDKITDPHIWKLVAKEFAAFHVLPEEEQDLKFFASIYNMIDNLPDHLENLWTVPEVMQSWTKTDYIREVKFLESCVERLESPVVFCHCDPLPENIIYSKSSDRVMFIDFEFSGFNRQAIDLASYFCEFAGVSNPDYGRFPSPEFQKQWLQVYLSQWFQEISKPQEYDLNRVEQLYSEICVCVPVIHFFAALTTLSIGIRKNEPTLVHTSQRFEQYLKTKHYAMTTRHLDLYVDVNKSSDLLGLLEIVKPNWKRSEVIFEEFTKGTINSLIACYVPPNVDDKVVMRIYAQNLDTLIDRNSEVDTALKLSAQGLAPQVLALFANGFCYQYVDGECLNEDTISDSHMSTLVAEAFAKLHTPATNGEKSQFFQILRETLSEFPETFDDPKVFPGSMKTWTKTDLLAEVDLSEKIVRELNSPIVFCHGDPHPANIIYDKSSERMMFIDFEFSSYGHQATDIAFLFCEFAGLENPDHSRFPNPDYQKQWLKVYWNRWRRETGKPQKPDAIYNLYRQVNACVPAIHLIVAIVTISMEMKTGKPNVKYAESRFNEFLRTKTLVSSG